MDDKRITYLYNQYLNKRLSFAELDELKAVLSEHRYENQLNALVDFEWTELHEEMLLEVSRENMDKGFAYIVAHRQKRSLRFWRHVAAAASIVLCLGMGLYWYQHSKENPKENNQYAKNDIPPGSNKAILTLANGKQIILTDANNGELARQGSTAILKTADGQVSYHASGSQISETRIAYNTMKTPRGGQYHLTLADGTNVWLNAASSIRYPTAFTGNQREVEITGEAYFEVAHNVKSFNVRVKGVTIEDLGTDFNINAYDDEPVVKTSLLEGSVKVSKGTEMTILKPGQQASTLDNSNSIKVENVDVEKVVAWKNGVFSFKNSDIQTVMRQFSRWYDVEVSYEGKIPQRLFSGDIHRNLKASQVLDALGYYDVHFAISGKKIIIKEK